MKTENKNLVVQCSVCHKIKSQATGEYEQIPGIIQNVSVYQGEYVSHGYCKPCHDPVMASILKENADETDRSGDIERSSMDA